MEGEANKLIKLLPLTLVMGAVVIGFTALLRGVSWNLLLIFAGLLVGLPILDLDKVLAKAIGTRDDVFHLFALYPIFFFLAIFVITASGSYFGRGMVLSMMLHSTLGFTETFQKRVGFGLLGLVSLLAIFS
ncbi:hypothetical protein A2872_03335 [Candidatus Gottesmanbacteria bacterium RIFCSPHIGHO2_01_FULL_42_12]|uniref:Uncharacterized protein n=1 Tax=Candidatus Gottesmanbacteria bacterium RIFCSPHIGHO2_01_FULL_42_12 TaxID=1798377 RepID=A0A1F5Z454_9BACT|nr:MAG: hypothetical protein A2872_03335 [Candidatus Gottesmanbacteria bacterium RIFCSPHIGHO2_01_FULL_42_12]